MTSLIGCDSPYQAVSDNFFSLSLTDNDFLFGTDTTKVNGIGPLKGGVNYSNLVKSMNIVDGEEMNPDIVSTYMKNVLNDQKIINDATNNIPIESQVPSIYNLIENFSELNLTKQLIDHGKFKHFLDTEDHITFIAPTSNAIQASLDTWLRVQGLSKPNDPFSDYRTSSDISVNDKFVQPYPTKYVPSNLGLTNYSFIQELLKAHTLNFELDQSSILNKKLELYTMHKGFSIVIDGTARIHNSLNVYQKPSYNLNYDYPYPTDRFEVVKIFKCKNGYLYIVDGMLSPSISI